MNKATTKAPRAAREQTLRIGLGARPDTIEPSQVTNTAVANLLENVVETLVRVDENGRIVPGLAESWKVSGDGRQFTFRLPRGATFQDGTPLDASAVAWNVNRLAQINLAADCPVVALELGAVESVTPVDGNAVRFSLSRPLPNFLATLSWIAWGILSPRSEKVPGNTLLNVRHPVGTGPYSFGALKGDQLQLTRFAGFRGERPHFGKLAFKFIASAAAREQALDKNQLDVVLLPSAKRFASLSRDAKFAVMSKPSTRSIFVNLHNQKPPFDDVRVRRAVNLAIDKQTLIDKVLRGAAKVSDSPVAPGVLGHCPVGPYPFDPAAAKRLLAEAGVRAGTPLSLLTPRGRYLEDEAVARQIGKQLGAVGFKVTVTALDWPAFMGSLMRPPQAVAANMHLFGWAPTFADAGWQLPQLYDSAKWPPRGPAGSFYKNPDVDRMLTAANLELEPRRRAELFCRVSRQIWDDAPAIFLWVQGFPVAHRAGLTGIVSLPNEKISAAFAKPLAAPPTRRRAAPSKAKPAAASKGKRATSSKAKGKAPARAKRAAPAKGKRAAGSRRRGASR